MKTTLVQTWTRIRSSYWFVPSLMAIGAIGLALAAVASETLFGDTLGQELPWFFKSDPVGARAFLSTVAGSMITVAGVTFSMTVVAVAHASTQLGPRLVGNFMADRGNQITLGTFIATFLYCIVVLRTVQAPEAPIEGSDPVSGFVPHIALAGAALMTLLSVAVLIYFIHHIPGLIRVSTIASQVFSQLIHKLEQQDDANGDQEMDFEYEESWREFSARAVVCARRSGYVQYVDGKELVRLAQAHGLAIEVVACPGAYICEGMVLLRVFQMIEGEETVTNEAIDKDLTHCIGLGNERTSTQDLSFMFEQLVEIAIRALSPGVNDPVTAMRCLDRVQSALLRFAAGPTRSRFRCDSEGNLRISFTPLSFQELVDATLVRYSPYAAADRNARLHLMQLLANLLSLLREPAHIAAVESVADRVMSQCETMTLDAYDNVELKRARKACDEAIGDKVRNVPPALRA